MLPAMTTCDRTTLSGHATQCIAMANITGGHTSALKGPCTQERAWRGDKVRELLLIDAHISSLIDFEQLLHFEAVANSFN
jgi:hypothetical protein